MKQLFDGGVSVADAQARTSLHLRNLGTQSASQGKTGAPAGGLPGAERGTFASDAFDLLHWAAVSLIIAATSAVLSYAAGTQDLAVGAHVASAVFSVLFAGLLVGGLLKWRERHGSASGDELPAEFRSSHLRG